MDCSEDISSLQIFKHVTTGRLGLFAGLGRTAHEWLRCGLLPHAPAEDPGPLQFYSENQMAFGGFEA